MANPTRKMIEVYEMLKDGKPFKFDTLVSRLGCKPVTAMVLICALKRDCGADIETIRDGRKVESYQLHNAAAIASKMVGKSKATKAPKAAKVAVLKTKTTVTRKPKAVVDEVPTVEVEEVGDAELASLKAELGLSDSYSE
jgi:signal-transduction protein with cAMP-binding, CBS, and nucleotidyltransferase domain